ncbi:MAG: hypothetical protein ACOYN3_03245 [Acidimicrobiia bacterium]
MRLFRLGVIAAIALTLGACGGSSKKTVSSTTTPLPSGCPAQTLMTIVGSSGPVQVAAATRKAVTRNNFITVYLFAKLLTQPDSDYKNFIGASFRVDGEGAIIASGKNSVATAPPSPGSYTTAKNAPLQLLEYSVQQNGRLLTTAPAKPSSSVTLEISTLTSSLVCGTITGPQGSSNFIADRIDAN